MVPGCYKLLYLYTREKTTGLAPWRFIKNAGSGKAQGYSGFVTWGLAKNVRARQFYEREGGKIVGGTVVTIGNKEYEEYCYMFSK